MYFNAAEKEGVSGNTASASFAIELTRSSAEIDDYERRHDTFLQNITVSDAEGQTVAADIKSIAKEHRCIGKRDFSDCTHYKRFQPTNDNKCINVRDDQISKFPNGDTYDGQFLDTASSSSPSLALARDQDQDSLDCTSSALLKHGRGTCKYANGDQYEGDWSYDKWYVPINQCIVSFSIQLRPATSFI